MSLGLAENTLVIWTADHGDGVASHGGRFDKGSYLTEEVLRVPLALRHPLSIPAAQVSDTLSCGTDIAPTILDAAGLKFAQPVDGESLLPLATGDRSAGRESLLVETYGHGFGTIELGRAVIKGRFKLIAWQNHAGELYDLEADPYEMTNLYGDPAFALVLSGLEEELERWLRKTGDRDFHQPITKEFRQEDYQRFQELLQRRARVNNATE